MKDKAIGNQSKDYRDTLMSALRCCFKEHTVAVKSNESLLVLAAEQKVLPLLVDALCGTAAEGWDGFPEAKRLAKMQVAAQTVRTERFLEIYNALRSSGVTPLVVKGIVCRSVWPNGELRPSADEDLFVGTVQFDKSCAVLRKLGCKPMPKSNEGTDDEVTWRTADGCLTIELHRTLFSTSSPVFCKLEQFFSDAFSHPSEYEVRPACIVLSLNEHDHLLYLILHAFKHFIYSGFGIRQVCDIGLWAERYAERIDWERLERQLACVRADVFAAAVFQIARKHLGMDLPNAMPPEKGIDCERMLDDLLSAGVYGTAGRSRQHSATLTFRAVESGKRGSLLSVVFPSRKKLWKDYPELLDRPYRLPLVWCKRLNKYRKERKNRTDSSTSETIKIAKSRQEMLRYYKIL